MDNVGANIGFAKFDAESAGELAAFASAGLGIGENCHAVDLRLVTRGRIFLSGLGFWHGCCGPRPLT